MSFGDTCGDPAPSRRTGQGSVAWSSWLRAFVARARGVGFLLRSLFQARSEVGGIEIRGRQAFCDQVAAALRLLRTEVPEAFALCQRHFDLVIMSRHSGVDVGMRPAIVMLGEPASTVSMAYLASDLAHEAMHCSLYRSYSDRDPDRDVPAAIYSGEDAERQCLEYQISVLKQLGETDADASRLRDLMKTKWWNVPWHERTW